MVKIEGTEEEIRSLFGVHNTSGTKKRRTAKSSKLATTGSKAKSPKKKRQPSKYNLFMKKELPRLRKKHPRMKQPQLMKKAAAEWRKKNRGKK